MKPELEQLAGMQSLDAVADLFEASPRDSFTKDEVVRTIRAARLHLFDFDCNLAYEMASASYPLTLDTSLPS